LVVVSNTKFIPLRTSLKESGLRKDICPANQLHQLEKMMRMHYEMDINIEGVETVTFLLERMHMMQQQVIQLTNRLIMYETERE
jgi:hypothetical protein